MSVSIKDWQDIAESLSSEVKREVAEHYFLEKKFLEESWEAYQKELKEMDKLEEKLLKNICRLVIMLKDDELIDDFREITGLDLKECRIEEIFTSENIKKRLFKELGAPFAFTSKNRFVKLFLKIYKDLQNSVKAYNDKLKDFQNYYQELAKETEAFHKRFDLSAIFNFFSKLSASETADIGETEDKGKIYEELSSKLSVKKPSYPTLIYRVYKEPKPLSEISGELISLAKTAFSRHKKESKEILELADKKD